MVLDNLSRKHGLMLVDDPEFLHCCDRCEVAISLGGVESCPQRIHTSSSCCPSCGIFLEHGLESMLSHWKDQAHFMAAFQIVVPFNQEITEEIIRTAFRLRKVPLKQLGLIYEWKYGMTLDITFEKHLNWVMTIRHNFWPLNLDEEFLRDPLIFGLAGFPARAGATIFSQLNELFEDLEKWLTKHYQVDPKELFSKESKTENYVSYYVSYYLGFENAENISIDILAPDYERSSAPETCLVQMGIDQIPIISFQKVNEALIMQKGLLTTWETIEPALQKMLDELSIITTEMRAASPQQMTVPQLSEVLDSIQLIQEQFLKLKPSISSMQGHLTPIVPHLSEPLIQKLFPNFNLSLMNSWLDFARSVERSVEGANSYIRGKMNLLALDQEKRVTKRLNLLTALFGSLSGLNLLVAFYAWSTPQPTDFDVIILGLLIVSLIILTLLFVARVVSRD
ncbi:MAG: hypothetical protein ACFFAJ_11220 [Candidatus Hodarchaeota archaeon]